jgi:polysaccharide export outer membrane protein
MREDVNVKLNRTLQICVLMLFALLASAAARAAGDYGLSSGDLVRITVYEHPDLATETRVNEQGGILFPLVGEVSLANLTASEASRRIAKALESGGFIRAPQVNLVVMEFKGREVSVLGRVNRPGKYPLQKVSRLSDVLALAGGIAADGADTLVLTSRTGKEAQRREIDLVALLRDGSNDLNIEIGNDDILFVPREPRFYIYGEVQRPGSFRLEKNMSLVQALAVGGGLTPRGTQKGIKLMRRGAEGKLVELDARLSDPMQTDDVIYVKESLF